jgi:REP element-mobilizing transposase RayT
MACPHHPHLAHLSPVKDGLIAFLTTTTHLRRRILAQAPAHETLREIWERSASLNGWFVGRYVLMPDHVHLFARPVSTADPLATWMKAWKSISSRKLATTLGITPPVWQVGYFDRYLRSDESYTQKWDYVVQNPVRAGLVSSSSNWPHQGEIHPLE